MPESTFRVERVHPRSVVEEAAAILNEAWPPPALAYTPAGLSWQFSFPGREPPLGVMAFADKEPVGFAATTPRRVRLETEAHDVHVVSFVSVRPNWQSCGLGARLYAELLSVLREKAIEAVTFAFEGSPGERSIARAYPAAGLHLRPLARHHVYAYRHRGAGPDGLVTTMEPLAEGVRVLADLAASGPASSVLWSSPDPEEAQQHERDPRPHALLLVRSPEGEVRGGATAVRNEIVTHQGREQVAALETVFLRGPEPNVLRALLEGGATLWRNSEPATVTTSSLSALASGLVQAVGLRRLPATFRAFVAARDITSPLLRATATNLAVT
jgi:GNAT superfamily N-acetyltransferase